MMGVLIITSREVAMRLFGDMTPKALATSLALLSGHIHSDATSYAPTYVSCPDFDIMRSGDLGLNSGEADWIRKRDSVSQVALAEWLHSSKLETFDVDSYLERNGPIRVSLAFSGGGARGMLGGAGMLAALDARVPGTDTRGGFGGLLQASSYISALSGSSWLVGSVAANNWSTITELQASETMWNFQHPFQPSTGVALQWEASIIKDVFSKKKAKFPVSLLDIWGRLLSAEIFGSNSAHGRAVLWSGLRNWNGMVDYSMPLPILVADNVYTGNDPEILDAQKAALESGQLSSPLNTTLYEITPFEFGSWDPGVKKFIDLRYLGTEMWNGKPATPRCALGLDNAGFLIGASSSLFNEIEQRIVIGPLKSLLNKISPNWMSERKYPNLAFIGSNPFRGMIDVDKKISSTEILATVDGGDNGENLPLNPLLHPSRSVDVIFALDHSADTPYTWPNGTALRETYQRQFIVNNIVFPYIPSAERMLSEGLNKRPTFFGCSVDQFQDNKTPPPLIVYVPNSPQSFSSNFSTFKQSYSNYERDEMIRNGVNVMTQNNGTTDPSWRTCAACAILLRSQQRHGLTPTRQCVSCFAKHCHDETRS